MFGDEDKILSPKVGGAGTEKHSLPRPPPVPDIYIYMYMIYIHIYLYNIIKYFFKHFLLKYAKYYFNDSIGNISFAYI